MGLWAIAGVRVTVPVFYALQDTATPVRVGIIAVLSTILFSLLLMEPLQHAGLALALSIASGLNLVLLLYLLRKRTGPLGFGALIPSLIKIGFAAAGMGVFCAFVSSHVNWLETGLLMKKLLYLGGAIFGSVAIYFCLAYVVRCSELEKLKNLFTGREQ
jgi:putative peptidoglycan lipid II flippase